MGQRIRKIRTLCSAQLGKVVFLFSIKDSTKNPISQKWYFRLASPSDCNSNNVIFMQIVKPKMLLWLSLCIHAENHLMQLSNIGQLGSNDRERNEFCLLEGLDISLKKVELYFFLDFGQKKVNKLACDKWRQPEKNML